jgi:two-component system osmolarity sensor histidine kinase EnvZ
MFKLIKKHAPKTLLGRLMLILILPTVLAQALSLYIFYERHLDNVSRHLAQSLAGEVATLTEYIESANNAADERKYLSRAYKLFAFSPQIMVEGEARQHVSGLKPAKLKQYSRALRSIVPRKFEIYTDNDRVVTTLVYLKNNVLVVDVPYKRVVNSTSYIFVLWMTGVSTLLLLFSLLFLKNQIRPVVRLARLADNFGRGIDTPLNIKPEGANEVRLAYKAFANMQQRISRFIKQRTDMLAGISHDLRTPLTRMKLALELGQTSEIKQDIEDLERMINSYIEFIKSDEGEEKTSFDMTQLVLDEAAKYKNTHIVVQTVGKVMLTAKNNAVRRVIKNLLDNSVKYATRTEVKVAKQAGYALVEVEDNGLGIPPEKYEEVFKPFYRIDESRSGASGSGLGLSIVKDIITNHGGYISLTSSNLGGLKVQVYLPL